MNKTLHIIMPMGGAGSRFLKEGIEIPKQLLYCNGLPIFAREALEFGKSIKKFNNVKYTFIVRSEHINNYDIDKRIESIFEDENFKIVKFKGYTLGPGHTVHDFLNKEDFKSDEAVLLLDCDVYIKSNLYKTRLLELLNNTVPSGLLCSFKSNDPRYSYALLGDYGKVIKTAEKDVISNNALTGAYFFNDSKIFYEYLEKVCLLSEQGKLTESYISSVFDELIKDKYDVYLENADYINSYGTPQELFEVLNKQKINAIITDFDGTLFDTREANFQAYARAFWNVLNFDLEKTRYDECFGLRFPEMVKKLHLNINPKEHAQIREQKAREYLKIINDGEIKINQELYDRLLKYKQKNIPIVLATTASRTNVDNILKKFSMENFFDKIIYGEDVKHSKPNPDVYYQALQFLFKEKNITNYNQILVFEDSAVGMKSAWNAGLQFEKITI